MDPDLSQDIKRARFNNGLIRLLGMDADAPAAQLFANITPSIDVEPGPHLERDFLLQTRWWSWNQQIPAVAAKTNAARILNPANSGMLVVVTQMIGGCVTADSWFAGIRVNNPTALASGPTAGSNVSLDSRWGIAPSGASTAPPFARCSFDNSPPGLATSNIWSAFSQANQSVGYFQPVILGPGSCLDFQNNTVNVFTQVCFAGYERALPDVELSN